jgi:hypothetical protein
MVALAMSALLFACPTAHAAFELRWPAARTAAMFTDDFDLIGCSLLAGGAARPAERHAGRCASLSTGELFGVAELRGWSARVSAPVHNAAISLGISSLGGSVYRERDLNVRVMWLAEPDTELAAGVSGLGVSGGNEQEQWTTAFDVAATRRVLGRILLGVRCCNVTGSEIGGSSVSSGSTFAVALELPGIALQAGTLMEDGVESTTSLGFEADLSRWLRMRAGATSSPGMFGLGLGLGDPAASGGPRWPVIDLAWRWHPMLGGSSFVSLEVCF